MIDRSFALGRVLTLIDKLYDSPILEGKYWSRPKDACDWFEAQTKERQEDVIHEIAYGLEGITFELAEILSICRGQDDISQQELGIKID